MPVLHRPHVQCLKPWNLVPTPGWVHLGPFGVKVKVCIRYPESKWHRCEKRTVSLKGRTWEKFVPHKLVHASMIHRGRLASTGIDWHRIPAYLCQVSSDIALFDALFLLFAFQLVIIPPPAPWFTDIPWNRALQFVSQCMNLPAVSV